MTRAGSREVTALLSRRRHDPRRGVVGRHRLDHPDRRVRWPDVRGERGVLFCGAPGHTTAAAFDRTMRTDRLSPTEALRTA
jgi:hypothetical protein